MGLGAGKDLAKPLPEKKIAGNHPNPTMYMKPTGKSRVKRHALVVGKKPNGKA